MHLRDAIEADLPGIARVQARAMVASAYYDEAQDEEATYRRLYPRIKGYFDGTYHPGYALAERTMIVAAQQEQVVGFVAGHRSTRLGCTGELQWMFVRPRWQRQGIGSRLLAPLQRWFVRQRSTRVLVDAAPENPARAFYLRHRARPLDAYWLYWEDIGEVPVGRQAR